MLAKIGTMAVVALIIIPPIVVIMRTFTAAMIATGAISAQDLFWVTIIPVVLSVAPIWWIGSIIYNKFFKKDEQQGV
jgi:hypothetical protein